MIGGRETRYGWQGIATAVHARGIGARVCAEVGGAVPWVAGHGVGRARGDVQGKRARAARMPVGRCQGRGAGKACAGAGHSRVIAGWARRVGASSGIVRTLWIGIAHKASARSELAVLGTYCTVRSERARFQAPRRDTHGHTETNALAPIKQCRQSVSSRYPMRLCLSFFRTARSASRAAHRRAIRESRFAIVAIRVACVLGDRTTEICTP